MRVHFGGLNATSLSFWIVPNLSFLIQPVETTLLDTSESRGEGGTFLSALVEEPLVVSVVSVSFCPRTRKQWATHCVILRNRCKQWRLFFGTPVQMFLFDGKLEN